MELFFTGAKSTLGDQSDPSKSLGGYISNYEVQNDLIGNLFPNVSQYGIQLNRPIYRCISILNNDPASYTGLKVYTQYPEDGSPATDVNIATLELGYALFAADNCGEPATRKINNENAAPYNVIFKECDGLANALVLPQLDTDMYLAIWIKRVLKPSLQTGMTDAQYQAVLAGTLVLPQEENISLTFTWN